MRKKTLTSIVLIFICLTVFLTNGIAEAAVTVPTVQTNAATSIGQTSATLNGVVTANGGATITEYGFRYCVYGTGTYTTVKTSGSINTNTPYSKTITGLSPGVKYSYYAYAKNSVGESTATSSEYFTTVAVDKTAPVITISSPSNGQSFTKGATVSISATATDNTSVSGMGIYLDGSASKVQTSYSGSISYNWNTSSLSTGSHSIRVTAVDPAGNSSEKVISITIAAAITTPTVETLEETNVGQTSATLNGVVTANGGATITEYGFRYCVYGTGTYTTVKTSGSINTNTPYSKTITGLSPGVQYSYYAYAINSAGESTPASSEYFTTVAADTTAPVITISSPSNGQTFTKGATVSISATATDNTSVSGMGIYLDGSATKIQTSYSGSISYSWNTSSLSTGSHSIRVTAVDPSGNSSEKVISITIAAVVTTPTVETSPETNVGQTSATLNGVVTANGGATITEYGFRYCVYGTGSYTTVKTTGSINTNTPYSKTITGLSPGVKYSYYAYAKNSAGESTAASSEYFTTVAVDTTAPVITISSPSNGQTFTKGATVSISATAIDNTSVSGMGIYLDGSTSKVQTSYSGSISYNWNTSSLSTGSHSIRVTAVDPAGNSSEKVISITIAAAITTPTVTTSPATNIGETSATLNGVVTANGGNAITEYGFRYCVYGTGNYTTVKTTGSINTNTPYSKTITGLSPGVQYSYYAYAINSAGESTPASSEYFTTMVSDTEPPVITVISPKNGDSFVQGSTVNISATATDNTSVSGMAIYLDGSATKVQTSYSGSISYNWNTSGLSIGTHTIKITAVDPGNKSSEENISISVTASDTEPPVITVISPKNGDSFVQGSTVNISATATDNTSVSGMAIYLDGSATKVQTSYSGSISYSWDTSGLSLGTHTIRVTAVDPSNKSDEKVINITITSANTTSPIVISYSPDVSTPVAVNTNLVLTFDQNVTAVAHKRIRIMRTADDSEFGYIFATDKKKITISGNIVTINPSSDLLPNTGYYILIDSGAFKNSSNMNCAGISSKSTWNFTTAQISQAAPTVSSYSPADNAKGVALDASLVLTFDQNITAVANKNITIKKTADGSLVGTIPANDTSRVTVSNNKVTINPSNDLLPNTGYYILIDSGAFKNSSNMSYAGISSKNTWNFTTSQALDNEPPVITVISPKNGESFVKGSTVNINANATDNTSVSGMGIYLDGSTVKAQTSNNGSISYSWNTSSLSTGTHTIRITAVDPSNKSSEEHISISVSVADITAPTVVSTDPVAGTIGVAIDKTITLTYSEAIAYGSTSQNITLTDASGNPVNYYLGINNQVLTVDPTESLSEGTIYTITVPAGLIVDLAGNAASQYTFSFTIAGANTTSPIVISYSPDGSTPVAVDTDLVLTFDQNVTAVDYKRIRIMRTADDSEFGSILTVDTTKITVSGNIVTVNPSSDLLPNTGYYILIDSGAFKNSSNMDYAGISSKSTWNFITAQIYQTTKFNVIWNGQTIELINPTFTTSDDRIALIPLREFISSVGYSTSGESPSSPTFTIIDYGDDYVVEVINGELIINGTNIEISDHPEIISEMIYLPVKSAITLVGETINEITAEKVDFTTLKRRGHILIQNIFSGQTISGKVKLGASSDMPLKAIHYYVDNVYAGTGSTYLLDTTKYGNGYHKVAANGINSEGNLIYGNYAEVWFDN